MTTHKPEAVPQEGNYDVLRQRVIDMVDTMHADDAANQELAAPELSAVIRVASEGVLRQLQERGVREAGTLAIRLGEAAQLDNLADLSHTVADRYTSAQGRRESGVDSNAQAQQRRMALLAGAAGETAVTIVASVITPDSVAALTARGHNAVQEYDTAAHRSSGTDLLNGLLKQAEESAQSLQEPLAV